MTNSNYRKGADFERRVKKKLESDGWIVFRSAGSHSPADLIAAKRDTQKFEYLLIQCKGGGAGLTKREKAEFKEYAESHGFQAVLASAGLVLEFL